MITAALPAVSGTPAYLPYVVGVIIALLGGGGLAALVKSGREGSKIIVDAAQGAVVVQSGVIKDLERRIDELEGLRSTVGRLEEENRLLLLENGRLMTRQRELESENAALERRIAELEAKEGNPA